MATTLNASGTMVVKALLAALTGGADAQIHYRSLSADMQRELLKGLRQARDSIVEHQSSDLPKRRTALLNQCSDGMDDSGAPLVECGGVDGVECPPSEVFEIGGEYWRFGRQFAVSHGPGDKKGDLVRCVPRTSFSATGLARAPTDVNEHKVGTARILDVVRKLEQMHKEELTHMRAYIDGASRMEDPEDMHVLADCARADTAEQCYLRKDAPNGPYGRKCAWTGNWKHLGASKVQDREGNELSGAQKAALFPAEGKCVVRQALPYRFRPMTPKDELALRRGKTFKEAKYSTQRGLTAEFGSTTSSDPSYNFTRFHGDGTVKQVPIFDTHTGTAWIAASESIKNADDAARMIQGMVRKHERAAEARDALPDKLADTLKEYTAEWNAIRDKYRGLYSKKEKKFDAQEEFLEGGIDTDTRDDKGYVFQTYRKDGRNVVSTMPVGFEKGEDTKWIELALKDRVVFPNVAKALAVGVKAKVKAGAIFTAPQVAELVRVGNQGGMENPAFYRRGRGGGESSPELRKLDVAIRKWYMGEHTEQSTFKLTEHTNALEAVNK